MTTYSLGVNAKPTQNLPDQQRVLENAAAASESGDKPLARGDQPYTSEVTREQNLWNANGFPYIALKAACPDCKERKGIHKPYCYGSQCTACGYYGHKIAECKHAPRPGYRKGGGAGRS